jgi:hypothetical protein
MTGDTKESLLEDRIFLVPEGKGGTDILVGVRVSSDAIFALASKM